MSDESEKTKVVDEDFEGHKLSEGEEVDPGKIVDPARLPHEPDDDDFEGHKLKPEKASEF